MKATRERYKKFGFSRLKARVDPESILVLRTALEEWVGTNPERNEYGILRNNVWRKVPAYNAVLKNSGLGELAADLLEENEVILFQDNIIWKPPKTSQGIEWHQDFAYWPIDRPLGVTFWIALSSTTAQNGSISYIPKSQTWGECQPTNFYKNGSAPWGQGQLPTLDSRRKNSKAELQTCLPGEILAHHPLMCHMSPPNQSTNHRIAWSITWLSTRCRWDPEHAPHPFSIEINAQKGQSIEGKRFPRFKRTQDFKMTGLWK